MSDSTRQIYLFSPVYRTKSRADETRYNKMVAGGEKKGKVVLAYSGGLGELDSLFSICIIILILRRHLLHSSLAH